MKQLKTAFLILLAGVLLVTKSYAGNYHPFVVNDSVYWNWTVIDQSGGGSRFLNYGYVFLMAGDTEFQGIACKKLFAVGNSKNDLYLIGFVWESGKKVYLKTTIVNPDSTNSDTRIKLLYDFNLQQGDSFQIDISQYPLNVQDGYYHVTQIDSAMMANGEYRERIHLVDNSDSTQPGYCREITWIEGIGSLQNVFYTQYFGCAFERVSYTDCMNVNGSILYDRDSSVPCHTDAAINMIKEANKVTVYPNPTDNYINIRNMPEMGCNYKFEVINAFGQSQILDNSLSVNQAHDISGLKPGMYFLRVTNAQTSAVMEGRFVKE